LFVILLLWIPIVKAFQLYIDHSC